MNQAFRWHQMGHEVQGGHTVELEGENVIYKFVAPGAWGICATLLVGGGETRAVLRNLEHT